MQKKTKMMIFHHQQRNISNINLKLCINGTEIEQVSEFNFLGIMLDECLTWNSHIQRIASKISVVNGTLCRLKKFLPSEILKVIYNALIQPHLNYGILLWGNKTNRIHKLQKLAIRSITCSKYNAHTDPLFIQLKILKVQDIYKLSVLKFFYKYNKDILPNYFRLMFESIYPSHDHFTRQREQPVVARGKSKIANQSIRYSLPQILANTQQLIIEKLSTHSFNGFVNYTKHCFIAQYNPACSTVNCFVCKRAET